VPEYKIIHDRNVCIGCGTCAATCQDFWDMNKDGKSTLKNAKKNGSNFELQVNDLACNKDAAGVCPVNCIHIIDMKTNKKII
jgi:ferredoxin